MAVTKLTTKIWNYLQRNNMWLTAVHLPDVQNAVADRESRLDTR
jgi:hypothetical protein